MLFIIIHLYYITPGVHEKKKKTYVFFFSWTPDHTEFIIMI